MSKLPAALRKYAKVIDEISDERSLDQGYWIYLKPGWINTLHDLHQIHEDTLKECVAVLKNFVTECNCNDCKEK